MKTENCIIEDLPSKTQQVYNQLSKLLPSEKSPHIDALEIAGLIDQLPIDQLCSIVILMQTAYRNGQFSRGAEKIDNDIVWVDGIGGIERQPNGTWILTTPDGKIEETILHEAAVERGRKGGQAKSLRKTDANRLKAKKPRSRKPKSNESLSEN